jgi:hypothetical protein
MHKQLIIVAAAAAAMLWPSLGEAQSRRDRRTARRAQPNHSTQRASRRAVPSRRFRRRGRRAFRNSHRAARRDYRRRARPTDRYRPRRLNRSYRRYRRGYRTVGYRPYYNLGFQLYEFWNPTYQVYETVYFDPATGYYYRYDSVRGIYYQIVWW